MSAKNTIINPKLWTNYIAAIVSLTILLYVLGFGGLLTIYGNQLVDYSTENIAFYIELKDDVNETEVFAFQKKLEISSFVKQHSVEYISKDKALEDLKEDPLLNREDILLFGDNLLPNMIRFHLSKTYNGDNDLLIQDLQSNHFVEQVFSRDTSIENISTKLYRLEIIVLILVIFFIFVVITLIKNTLKLILIANKETIRIIQTVGATWEFMTQPYLRQSIKNGFGATMVAVFAIWMTRFLFESDLDAAIKADINILMIIISFGMLFIGVIISWWCTQTSMQKFFGKSVDDWEI